MVKVTRADNGNGKKTVMVREREYPLASWSGIKVLGSFLAAIIGVTFAVLTAYYTAEASQNARISDNDKKITKIDQREVDRGKLTEDVFTRINKTLDDHQQLMRKTNDTLIKVHTTQQHIEKRVDEMSEDIKQLRKTP